MASFTTPKSGPSGSGELEPMRFLTTVLPGEPQMSIPKLSRPMTLSAIVFAPASITSTPSSKPPALALLSATRPRTLFCTTFAVPVLGAREAAQHHLVEVAGDDVAVGLVRTADDRVRRIQDLDAGAAVCVLRLAGHVETDVVAGDHVPVGYRDRSADQNARVAVARDDVPIARVRAADRVVVTLEDHAFPVRGAARPVVGRADVVADDLVAVRLHANASLAGAVEVADRQAADRRAVRAGSEQQAVRLPCTVAVQGHAHRPGRYARLGRPVDRDRHGDRRQRRVGHRDLLLPAIRKVERDSGNARCVGGIGGVDRLAERAVGRVAGAIVVIDRRVHDVRRRGLEGHRVDRGVVTLERGAAVVGRLHPVDMQSLVRGRGGIRDRVDR